MVVLLLGAGLVVLLTWRRPRPIAKLVLHEKNAVGLEFLLTAGETTLGSEEAQTITISHPRVSRLHATLTLREDEFHLTDRSQFGTALNGTEVSEAVLRSGDMITLGGAIDLTFTRLG